MKKSLEDQLKKLLNEDISLAMKRQNEDGINTVCHAISKNRFSQKNT